MKDHPAFDAQHMPIAAAPLSILLRSRLNVWPTQNARPHTIHCLLTYCRADLVTLCLFPAATSTSLEVAAQSIAIRWTSTESRNSMLTYLERSTSSFPDLATPTNDLVQVSLAPFENSRPETPLSSLLSVSGIKIF